MFRPAAMRVFVLFSVLGALAAEAADTANFAIPAKIPDSVKAAQDTAQTDTTARKPRVIVPDSSWRWPMGVRARTCEAKQEYPETPGQCWRQSPRRALIETGFPGIRALEWNLNGLEFARTEAFYQAALAQSPYGTGGHIPFEAYESNGPGGVHTEIWAPVQPIDTPITDLHWTRGALLLNQFGVRLRRMAGNRAYVGFDFYSNSADKQAYDYAFQVHQPYLGSGRDSSSVVITDTSHNITSQHARPRLGFWLGPRTVVEGYADWLANGTSMANPTNISANDSVQLLYPASFGASTYGAVFAHAGDDHAFRFSLRHGSWDRSLSPRGDSAARYAESSSGTRDALDAEWTLRALVGDPRLSLGVERTSQDGALWTEGVAGGVTDGATGDRESVSFDSRPDWGFLALLLRGEGARRHRPDGVEEMLYGGDADATLRLPWGFRFTGGTGWNREGAPEDWLFRNQPALGLYPSPGLKPRAHARMAAGAGWESRFLSFGAEAERHRFEDTWLPRALPEPGVCALIGDSLAYPTENASGNPACSGLDNLPDSLALGRVNYHEETRDLAHLWLRLSLGNWKLSLRNTYLLANAVRDPRLGFVADNWTLPRDILKGQLLWRRVILDGKLGLQTRWDWEWISNRYVFASDID
ncbi:MAG TPA: hypothetical protein VHO02_09115, partial [Fibrobacteria bacterium]|nr:hypothetical protein [Fibrobacteria bacterium]